jgi:hypothetical protein
MVYGMMDSETDVEGICGMKRGEEAAEGDVDEEERKKGRREGEKEKRHGCAAR